MFQVQHIFLGCVLVSIASHQVVGDRDRYYTTESPQYANHQYANIRVGGVQGYQRHNSRGQGAHQPIPPLNYHYSYGSHGKILYHPLGPLLPAYDFNGYPIGVPRVHDNVLRNGQPVLPHEGPPEYDPLPPHNTISVPPFEDAGDLPPLNSPDVNGETRPDPSEHMPCGGECRGGEFLCGVACTCIPTSWRCDGDSDCVADEDEIDCGVYGGSECLEEDGNVQCPRTRRCIRKEWLCDGEDDCGDFSDETHCGGAAVNCSSSEFECSNGLCIQMSWLCDGDNDCKDYSDEMNCTRKTDCTEHEFRCSDGSCISLSWKCDFEPDCSDGTDEAECQVDIPQCSESEFQCAYPRCVRQEFRCDGDDDCGDWSDEDECPKVAGGSCARGEFRCNSGKCIPDKWRCDEERDCEGGEDEDACEKTAPRTCGPDEYVCKTGNCILKTWVCDGVQDCAQGEDEGSCVVTCDPETQFACNSLNETTPVTQVINVKSLPPHSVRPSSPCITKKHVCDGKKDCHRGEDERNCPRRKTCERGTPCKQACVTLADGQDGCSCFPGYSLSSDGTSCHDVDECAIELDPVCSQTCANTVGSFQCGCSKGYVLRPDGRTCKALGAPSTLLFANRIDIRQVSLNNIKYTAILKGLHNAIALDYHYKKGLLFWSDVSMDVIRRARLNGTEAQDVIRWGLESPGGVAVDWIHDLLFWTDSGTRRVEVASLDGKKRHVLASNDLDKPRAIAVHPGEALVFWTDWGPNPKIERIEMDGSQRKSIITESVFWPNGLTLDYTANRIYWADAKHHVIESAKLDGMERRKVITKGLPHPFALTLFEDSIYWTDWHTKSISTANKASGSGFRTIHSGLHFPMDIHSYHPQRQPNYTSHCGEDNGRCSHLCLPNKHSFKCACPLGLKLTNNRITCDITPDKLLLFARKKDIRLRRLDSTDESYDIVFPVDGVKSAVALAWDSNSDSIFWSDVEADLISRAFLNGSRQQIVVGTNLESPAGLAVDWVTDKLYWTDAGTNRIEVSSLNGSMRSLLIWDGLDKPRDIVVDPIGGFMYWSDWGVEAKIERAGMDGSQRLPLVTTNLKWPNGLAIDHDKGRLYWADGGTKAIEYATLDGKHRTVLISNDLPHPFGLAVFGNKVYWTDWDTASIHVANKENGSDRSVLRSGISGLMDVRVFHRNRQPLPSMCHANNGGCSHLCLIAPLPEGFACACPIGIKLLKDGRTCASGPTNSLIVAHRVDLRQISLDVPYIVDVVLPLPPLKSAVAVDVDRKTGEIYWTDTEIDVIQKATPDGAHVEMVISEGLDMADGIVIDSTGRKIYWTDAGRNSIEVAELNGSNRKVLIWSDLDNPRAITLHYHLGLMYWSDWGQKPKIEQADMDGSNRMVLIHENLGWPNGLAIDRPSERLYWNDGKHKTIENSDLNGKDRRVIVSDVPHPYGLVIVGSHMYWTDWKTEALHRAEKGNGSDRVIIRSKLEGLMDIRSVQADNVAENACGNNNGGCSHLCLRSPHGHSCECPTGTLLQADRKTCDFQPNAYLLFAAKSSLSRVSLDTKDRWDVSLPVPGIQNAVAADFHWNKSLLVYTDASLDLIRSVDMHNLSTTEDLITTNLTTPDGLAVDWIANNIYWTDTGRKVLEVARIDGSCRKIIISKLDEPRAIAVYPKKGYLFWADWGDNPKIERSMMDGSLRTAVVDKDLGFPNGLTIDYEEKKLYWADALKDRIEMSNLNGKNRIPLVPEATHPYGLTQFGDHIYWTDWLRKAVEKADKSTGRNREAIRTELHGVMEIRAVSAERQTGWNPCAVNNGYCSHLCFFRGDDYRCSCPDVPDDNPCIREPSMKVHFPHLPDDIDDEQDGPPVDDVPEPSGLTPVVIVAGLCLCFGLIILALLIAGLLYHKRRRRTKKYQYAGGRSVLTFSNPNYNASSSDVGHSSDKRSLFWRKLKYDKSQERVYDINSESDKQTSSPEVVSLIPAPASPSNADRISITPEGVDNPSMKAG